MQISHLVSGEIHQPVQGQALSFLLQRMTETHWGHCPLHSRLLPTCSCYQHQAPWQPLTGARVTEDLQWGMDIEIQGTFF